MEFLTREEMPWASDECEDDPNQPAMPKPSLEDSNNWTLWHTLPGGNTIMVARAARGPPTRPTPPICKKGKGIISDAKSEVPCLKHGKQLFSAPPTPHCIDRDAFLPFNNMQFGGQDYHIKQPQKTLAYAKALQLWVEKARLTNTR